MNKLSDTYVVTRTVTYTVPHILITYEANNGFPILSLRQGGSVQVEATITTDFHDAPVEEQPFLIKARNQINFCDFQVYVLNDEITGIAPSCPTASEYMSKVGQTVLTFFSCDISQIHSRDAGKNVYRVIRSSIVLP